MPFNADTRAGLSRVEFNISVIWEWVEDFTNCDFVGEEKDIYEYTRQLENYYSNTNDLFDTTFNEWFYNEFDNVEAWDIIAKDLICRETEQSYYDKQNED